MISAFLFSFVALDLQEITIKIMGLKVYKECCKNCLLSENRIVSSKKAKQIISDCSRNQTHFICHKATMHQKEIICKTFFDTFGHKSQMIRIAGRLRALEFVDQSDCDKLPTYKEMSTRQRSIFK